MNCFYNNAQFIWALSFSGAGIGFQAYHLAINAPKRFVVVAYDR
ncbi:MAG: hypothetical protein Q4B71_03060 [Cardiobacteriaceae bacterium]|nr:hypothetical protein [Cardiobacteriaceae bacterium]